MLIPMRKVRVPECPFPRMSIYRRPTADRVEDDGFYREGLWIGHLGPWLLDGRQVRSNEIPGGTRLGAIDRCKAKSHSTRNA
jgi:hypothetical protein